MPSFYTLFLSRNAFLHLILILPVIRIRGKKPISRYSDTLQQHIYLWDCLISGSARSTCPDPSHTLQSERCGLLRRRIFRLPWLGLCFMYTAIIFALWFSGQHQMVGHLVRIPEVVCMQKKRTQEC